MLDTTQEVIAAITRLRRTEFLAACGMQRSRRRGRHRRHRGGVVAEPDEAITSSVAKALGLRRSEPPPIEPPHIEPPQIEPPHMGIKFQAACGMCRRSPANHRDARGAEVLAYPNVHARWPQVSSDGRWVA